MVLPFMMVLAVGRWLWHLSSLHHLDNLMDKIATRIGAQALEAGDPLPRTKRCHATSYPFREASPRWVIFLVGWPIDRPLDELGLMTFPLGLTQWVQTPKKRRTLFH
jgi:hypothetical protein